MIDPAAEGQYNNRANVPEHPELLAEWAARSAAWADDAKAMRTLSYGDGDTEILDLFLADAEGAPVHMYIHGDIMFRGDISKLFKQFMIRRRMHVRFCPTNHNVLGR